MNKTLMLVICDFLLISMLALARFDEIDPEVEERVAEEEAAVTEEQELIEVLEMSLEAELASRADLSEDLTEARKSLQATAEELTSREAALEQTRRELEQKAAEAEQLAATTEALSAQRARLEQEREQLAGEKQKLAENFEATRTRLTEADSERVELAKSLGEIKENASVMQERLRRTEEDLARRERELQERAAELEQARLEAQRIEAEKSQLAQNLVVAETRVEALDANLQTERMEKVLLQQEKEQAFKRTEKLSEGVSALAKESEQIRTEIEKSRPLTMSQIYTRFSDNRANIRFVANERNLVGIQSTRTYEPKSILVSDTEATYVIVHSKDTPFKLNRDANRILSVQGWIELGDRSYGISQAGFMAADPRLIFIPLPQQIVDASGLEVFQLSAEPERWEEAVLIKSDESNFGRTEFRRLTRSERYLRMDRPAFGELFSEFAASTGDQVFTKSGEFIGVMVDSKHAAVITAFLASGKLTLGNEFDAGATERTLERLRARIYTLPKEVQ